MKTGGQSAVSSIESVTRVLNSIKRNKNTTQLIELFQSILVKSYLEVDAR